ncbi:MAG: hypothetical protein IJ909_08320 [Fibrobacter sp.]|nr:hypothetical protein [Fibrobacter sp.]
MKTTIFATAILAAATAFAADSAQTTTTTAPKTDKGWTHFVGAGVTVPVSKYNIDNTDYSMVSGGVNLNYMGVGKSGFAVKVSWSAGAGFTDDVKFDVDDDNTAGTYTAGEVGVGYAFVNTPDWTVATLAMVGIEAAVFTKDEGKYRHEDLGKVDWTRSVTVGALTLGGDVVVRKALGKHAGVFASVGGRWVPVAASVNTNEYENDDVSRTDNIKSSESDGGFTVVPTVGAMWSF